MQGIKFIKSSANPTSTTTTTPTTTMTNEPTTEDWKPIQWHFVLIGIVSTILMTK